MTRRHGDTTITQATRTVMEKWGLEGFKFVLGETKNVYEEKRKVRERDKVGVYARTKCVCVCLCVKVNRVGTKCLSYQRGTPSLLQEVT